MDIAALCLRGKAVVLQEIDEVGRGDVHEDVLQVKKNCKEKRSF